MNLITILICMWPYIWDSGGNDFAKDVDVTGDGKIIAAVWTWDTLYKSVILKLDGYGNLLWESDILPNDAVGSCVEKIKTHGEEIYAIGYINLPGNRDIGAIWKIDAYGNVIYEKRWDEYENSYIKGIDFDQNGNLFIVGNIYINGRYAFRILKYDTNFNQLLEIVDSSYINNYGNDISVSLNCFYVCGEAWDTITSKWVWFLSKYKVDGNLEWKKIVGGNLNEDNHGICVKSDEMKNVYTGGYYWQPPGYNWWIEKRDSIGNLIWSYSIGLSNVHDILFDIDIYGDYVLIAGYKDVPPTWRWAMEKRDRNNGTLICSHTMSQTIQERFGQAIGIKGIQNGYMYIIGHRLDLTHLSWDVRISLYDPNCNMVLIAEKEKKEKMKSYLKINTFKNVTVIISDSKEPFYLYTPDGKKIGKVFPGEIFGKNLPAGKYYLKRKNEKLEFIKLGG